MKSILKNEYTYTIKNSKFISKIYPINSEKEIDEYINQAKKEYPDATHYCYAYILNNIRRENDDGEPSGTAGIPILQVLEKNNLNQVLCIVIRYFGKIKLGAGGLVRAYTKAATMCIKDHIIELIEGSIIEITFPYSLSKTIDYLLENSIIMNKEFKEQIIYQVKITNETLKKLEKFSNITIKILNTNIYI